MRFINTLEPTIQKIIGNFENIPEDRMPAIQQLIDYIQKGVEAGNEINLNFICTHNSRRSHLTQIWAKVASQYYGLGQVKTYSGGTEATAFNERAVASMKRSGFEITATGGDENPVYNLKYSEERAPIGAFSKVYDHEVNPKENFAAIMTCSHADQNCPFIPGTEARIPLRYEDPKAFDGTEQEAEMYDARSLQIATELFYAFSQVKN